MSRQWKPGDVAMVTIPGRSERQMVRYDTGVEAGWYAGAGLAFTDGQAHFSDRGDAKGAMVRPLAVVDLTPHQAEFVIGVLEQVRHTWTLRTADALRVLLASPDEPTGLGAVVEAVAYTDDARIFVRIAGDKSSWCDASGNGHDWTELTAVKVLSEGVTP